MDRVLSIGFAHDSVFADISSLRIEQEEWDVNTGYVTKASFFKFMYTLLSGAISTVSPVNCGFSDDGSIVSSIYVYPNPFELSYSLKATYGTLSDRVVQTHIEKEVINFSVADAASIKYKASNTPSYHWVGTVRNREGIAIIPPSVSIEDGNITLSEKVYGSLAIQYTVYRHTYTLSVPPREDSDEDLFGSVVYGIYLGGASWLEISNPPNVDAISTGEVKCGGSVSIGDVPPHAPDPPPPKYADEVEIKMTYDYCSQELTKYTKTYV